MHDLVNFLLYWFFFVVKFNEGFCMLLRLAAVHFQGHFLGSGLSFPICENLSCSCSLARYLHGREHWALMAPPLYFL